MPPAFPPDWVFVSALAGLFVLFVVAAGFSLAFCLRLKKHERRIWVALGKPMPGNYMALGASAKLLSFLRKREYEKLSDGTAARLGMYLRRANRALLIYIFVASGLVLSIVWIDR